MHATRTGYPNGLCTMHTPSRHYQDALVSLEWDSSTIITTRKSRTGDEVFPGDICRPGNVTKRQKSVRRGTNSDRLFSQSLKRVSRATYAYKYPSLPRVSLSYQASASSLSTLHFLKFLENSFEVLKLLENIVEVLKILENKLESMKILENKLESERRPESITPADWDAQIAFWNDPRNQARAAQNRQNRAKSTVVCRQGSRSLARLRDQMMESSTTREYPSLIHTFFVTHTVNGEFTRDEDQAIYALGSNTASGVPYTNEEINALA
ncbi:retrotransposon protein, putative, ty3-gypsy subclass [Tanacetum coccineum]